MSELKPCPFCGSPAEFERLGTSRQSCQVSCTNCNTHHESSDEGEMSGSSWNRRAEPNWRERAEKAEKERDQYKAENARLADEVKRGQWVKCEERLPDKDGRYLINSPSCCGVEECSFRKGKFVQWMPDDFGSMGWSVFEYPIIHWRELPNPPKD